jgi:N-acetylmuramoyl-L-alanine amidase
MSRYAVRTGSALALLLTLLVLAAPSARAAEHLSMTFQGKRFVFTQVRTQSSGRAIAIGDPGLHALLDALGATVTWQPGERYVLVTTGEPVVISFAIGSPQYEVGPVTQTASFAPFMLDGEAYVPLSELLNGLDLAPKRAGADIVLQPQLAALDLQSDGAGTKLIAHAGIPLDARIVSDSSNKLVVAFDGVGSSLQRARTLNDSAVRRIDIRTEGSADHPTTYVTLTLNAGTTHSSPGTDDQRDFTIGFNGAQAAQPVAQSEEPAGQPSTAPSAPEYAEGAEGAQPAPSPSIAPSPAMSGPAQVTAVQGQEQNGSYVVRVSVTGDASYDWHRLRPPDNRWWIDLHGARLQMPPMDQSGDDLVSAVRVHQDNADTVRVALSLSDFDVVNVVPDSSGLSITVDRTVADVDSAARTGSGSVGAAAVANATPPPLAGWKFGPRPAAAPPGPASSYVAANPRLIVIDPGHGGSDPGSYRGDAIEKNLTLDMARRLREILVARGWQVIMTRDGDRDVFAPNDSAHDELQARDDVANTRGARLFVSIHVNAFINSGPHGVTTYYYKPIDQALAQAVDRRIANEGVIVSDGTVKDKLYVVHHANMPATLIETAFVSNPDDRALLQSPQWRQRMARAIADGIGDYAGPPPAAASADGQ